MNENLKDHLLSAFKGAAQSLAWQASLLASGVAGVLAVVGVASLPGVLSAAGENWIFYGMGIALPTAVAAFKMLNKLSDYIVDEKLPQPEDEKFLTGTVAYLSMLSPVILYMVDNAYNIFGDDEDVDQSAPSEEKLSANRVLDHMNEIELGDYQRVEQPVANQYVFVR